MGLIYRIHPGIGIARVGSSAAKPFLAAERPGEDPLESDGTPFGGYKGADHLVRRQAVRYRVLEFERDGDGAERFVREITAGEAEVSWRVELAAAKAAGPKMVGGAGARGERVVLPDHGELRNAPPAGSSPADLVGAVEYQVAGPGAVVQTKMATIAGIDVMIGDARTDDDGRLIVSPGLGVARSWANPPEPIGEFLNNPTWFDDIADGPVDAAVTFADGRVTQAEGAWLVAAPPDFAPGITGLVTLFDVMSDAVGITPRTVFFDDHILPLLKRAERLRWVNDRPLWLRFAGHVANQALRNPAEARPMREAAANDLLRAERTLADFRFTEAQLAAIRAWTAGDFQPGGDPGRAPADPGAALDHAHLEGGVGGGFFPGIEIGVLSTLPGVFAAPFRFSRDRFIDHDGEGRVLVAGSVSQRMACPWQADFLECEGNWWPAQRPDVVRFREEGQASDEPWARGVAEGEMEAQRQSMVDHFARLGVVVEDPSGGVQIFKESGRDPTL
jgi:hypothetical protein